MSVCQPQVVSFNDKQIFSTNSLSLLQGTRITMEPAICRFSMKSLNYPSEEDKGSRVHMADPCGEVELSFGTINELEILGSIEYL